MKKATNSETDNRILESALHYRNEYGFPVIPVNITSENKTPHVSWKKYQDELPNEEQIHKWWNWWPNAGVGIVTGKVSGLLVLDVDTDEGWEYVREEKRIGSEPTPVVRTGSGHHIYYKHPDEQVKNEVRLGEEKYGLDIRAEGGFVVAPPSVHNNGKRYRWINNISNNDLQDPPNWLLEEIEGSESKGVADLSFDEIEDGVPHDQRNVAAARMAGKLFRMYGADSKELVWKELKDWNTNNEPPLDESELTDVFRSIKRAEQNSSSDDAAKGMGTSNSDKKSHTQLASEFLETEQEAGRHWQYVPESEVFYQYLEESGVWTKTRDQYLRSEVRGFAVKASRKLDKTHSINEIIGAIKDLLSYPENKDKLDPADDPNLELINVENGMLNWKDSQLTEHEPDYYSTLQLPIEYDPSASCELWEKTLKQWVPQEDTRKFLQEFIGYSLIPDTSRQKSIILYGSGSNGKSTFLEVIGALFGESNLTHIPLHRLANRFETGKLQGKLVNICPDIDSNYIESTGLLKTLIAGETLRAEEKYKPSYDLNPIARLIFSANELPNASDKTEAWYRRFEFVEFPRKFKPEDEGYNPNLKHDLLDELPRIFNWALEGLRRLKESGRFAVSESMKRSKSRYRAVNDSVKYFYEEKVFEGGVDDFLPTEYLYRKFKSFCDDAGMNTVSRRKFTKRLNELGLEKTRQRVETCKEHGRYKCFECESSDSIKRSQLRGFIGIRLSM
ncbi:bifunctional DNA primase/polymerase [Candidatus Bipolaricaulota bacterium]|nr:bifunctional DNA primase/polymerase [Candidatus Bipolaricaulota bacterium]